MQVLVYPGQRCEEASGRLAVEAPGGLFRWAAFQRQQSDPAILTSLQGMKVGSVASLAPQEEEGEIEELEEIELFPRVEGEEGGGPGPP